MKSHLTGMEPYLFARGGTEMAKTSFRGAYSASPSQFGILDKILVVPLAQFTNINADLHTLTQETKQLYL